MANYTPKPLTGAGRKFSVSLFNNKHDAKPRFSCETREQLEKRFSTFKVRANKDGALFSPATFKPAHRLKENVIELSALVFDVDGGMTINEADAKLRALGARAFIYTTHSHQRITKDHPQAEDRFRIVILLSEPIPAKLFPALWQWMNTFFDGKLDPACKDSSRAYYLSAIASKDAPFHFREFEGEPRNWRALDLPDEPQLADSTANDESTLNAPAESVLIADAYNAAAKRGEASRVETAPVGGRNNALYLSANHLGQLGIDQGEVESVLTEAALKAGLDKREIKATIRSGYKAGLKKPRKPQTNDNSRGTNMKASQKRTSSSSNGAKAQTSSQAKQQTASGNGASAQGTAQANSSGANTQNATQASGQPSGAGSYQATPAGLIRWTVDKHGNCLRVPLTNFNAEIIGDIIEDDGTETRRAYEIAAQLNGRSPRFLVSAEDFNSMKWVDSYLGAKAITHPRQAEYARCAIRTLSPQPVERRVYTHTGWREIDGEMCYLHSGGAIGAHDVKGVEVRLPEALQLVELAEPPEREALAEAMGAVPELMGIAADEITIPVIGAAFASVIGGADFSIWIYGATGTGKSQLAALVQSFFGQFTAERLPGNWASTANANEANAHAAKDMICVIDDFKPAGCAQDRARLHRDADRLLRAQGNQHGRQRMSADTTLRKTKWPRGLIFNTAEEVPRGESLVARLFVIETHKGSIDFDQLTTFQKYAANTVFATAMSGFIRWLAPRYTEKIEGARREIEKRRDEWAQRQIASHRRCATTLGHLSYAWELWIQAAQDAGALTEQNAQNLRDRVTLALGIAGSKQDSHANKQNPVSRFLELLSSAFASHRAHIENTEGGAPVNAMTWGWKKTAETIISPVTGKPEIFEHIVSCGERVGWHNGEEIYLLPDATFALLDRFSATGEGIGVQQSTLWKHLHEADILNRSPRAEQRREYTQLRSVDGRKQPVLVFGAGSLSIYADTADTADTNGG